MKRPLTQIPLNPALDPALARIEAAHTERRARWEQFSGRGALWLGLAALVFSILHAGVDRAFIHGWWRQW